jgi:hypothetical protein
VERIPAPARPVEGSAEAGPALHRHAADDLAFIRRTMQRAGSFTAVPGRGGMLMGVIGLLGAAAARVQEQAVAWLAAWLAAAAAALLVGVIALRRTARAAGVGLLVGPGGRFVVALVPAMVAGAVLTPILFRNGLRGVLPGAWLLLYGAGVVAGGLLSLRLVALMGALFMLLGLGALATAPEWGDAWMAAGFGGLHLAFGAAIARRPR